MALTKISNEIREITLAGDEEPKTIFLARPLTREEYAEYNLINMRPLTEAATKGPGATGISDEARDAAISAGVSFYMGKQVTAIEKAAFLDSEGGYVLRNLDKPSEIADFIDGLSPLDKQEVENAVFGANGISDEVKKRLRDTFNVPA